MDKPVGGYAEKIDGNLRDGYNGVTLGGDGMSVADIINDALKAKGWSQKQLAAAMNQSPQNLSKKLVNNTLSAQEFLDAVGHLGYEVKVAELGSSEELQTRKRGVGPRLRRMVNRVTYDTYKADALCHTPMQDGWYMELYRDEEGRYFVAHYTMWEEGVDFISPCGEEDARKLYEEHGDAEKAEAVFGVA